jgi:hypothetical protein
MRKSSNSFSQLRAARRMGSCVRRNDIESLYENARTHIMPSLRAQRSNPSSFTSLLRHGLLRGACHRARVRATRWLAMTRLRRLRRCLKFESSCVVPAHAGTHNHRPQGLCKSRRTASSNYARHGVWVPVRRNDVERLHPKLSRDFRAPAAISHARRRCRIPDRWSVNPGREITCTWPGPDGG